MQFQTFSVAEPPMHGKIARLCVILLILTVIATEPLGNSREDVFVGYSEVSRTVVEVCDDELGEDICDAYSGSNMCDTGAS